MPKVKEIIEHNLEISDVKKRLQLYLVEALSEKAEDDFLLCDESWDADIGHYAFMVGAYSISLTINVKASLLEISGQIPLVALPFRGQIKKDLFLIAHKILRSDEGLN